MGVCWGMNRNRVFGIVTLCFLLSTSSIVTTSVYDHYASSSSNYEEWLEAGERHREQPYSVDYYEQAAGAGRLTIDEYYRIAATHTMVIDFFVRLAGSERIALPIIYHAERNNVPLALMFSVSWVESKYKPYASNNNPSTTDRGLFQLNSASFYTLNLEDFFNPEINSLHAGRHLRYCLDKGAEDISTALAIYNAGLGRVRRNTIPASTKVYVSRIIEYRLQLISRFDAFIAQRIASTQITQQS